MKTTFFKLGRTFATISIIALLATSCQKEISTDLNREVDMLSNKPGTESIATIAINAGFDSLVTALMYVDAEEGTQLVDLFMNGKDQYTVFAPTDAAFRALLSAAGASRISDLPSDLVLNVLLYHVTGGRRTSTSVVPKNGLKTIETLLAGSTFSVDKDLMITAVGNTAMITSANINASNGIIHVINAVLLPIKL